MAIGTTNSSRGGSTAVTVTDDGNGNVKLSFGG